MATFMMTTPCLRPLGKVERIAQKPEHVLVDMGYRGHGCQGDIQVHVDKRKRGRTAKSMWRWIKRRAAIEPGIGHLKRESRMDRNRSTTVRTTTRSIKADLQSAKV